MKHGGLRRAAESLAIIVLGSAIVVVLVHLIPGDPLAAIIADRALSPDARLALEHQLGVGRPLTTTLLEFFAHALRGDLGRSIASGRPVVTILAEHLGPTLLLGGLTLLIDFSVGLALGLFSALRPRARLARGIDVVTLIGYTIPAFVIGMVLVWWFAVRWRWFPAAGFADPLLSADAGTLAVGLDRLRHLALPLTTMVLATIAVPLRQQRSAALDAGHREWVTAARARGVSRGQIAWHHIWRPALTPVVTLLGLWLPMLVSGAVFVEAVFAWPGIGSLLATATAERDVPVVIGAAVVILIVVQIGSLSADLLYRVVDPAQRDAA